MTDVVESKESEAIIQSLLKSILLELKKLNLAFQEVNETTVTEEDIHDH